MRRILPEKREIPFIKYRYVWFGISAVIIIVAAVALFTRGLNFGVDFTGGTEMRITTKQGTTIEQVRGVTSEVGYPAAQIQQEGDSNVFLVKIPKINEEKQRELVEKFKTDLGLTGEPDVNFVGPGWGSQVSQKALIAVIIFLVALLIYVSIRFEFKMAVTAIIEVAHDLIITVGVYALSGREVTPATVIAVLTILGYSLYDTIVIFDRVKENTDQLTRSSKKTYSEVVNDSINQVLVRSINTSLTTLIPIVCILIFGGGALQAFAFALFVGVLAGTYSSIILAPPILAMWKEHEPKYKAYRDRVGRAQAREAKVAASGAGAAAVKPKATAGTRPQARSAASKAGGARPAGKTPAGAKPKAKAPEAEQAGAPEVKPKPKPKPQPGQKPAQTSKAAAKNRTKGPGSGKKKKKKK